MAGNYSALKQTIDSNVKQNGAQQITGPVLNSVLNQMVSSIGANATFAGIATPDTDPGTPDQNVFYLATEPGTYTHFNNAVVSDKVAVLTLSNGAWMANIIDVPLYQLVSELLAYIGMSYPASYLTLENTILKDDGTTQDFEEFATSELLDIPYGADSIEFYDLWTDDGIWSGLNLYQDNTVLAEFGNSGKIDLSLYPTANKFRFCAHDSAVNCYVRIYKEGAIGDSVDTIQKDLSVKKIQVGLSGKSLANTFSATGMTTLTNTAAPVDGYIDSITLNVATSGTYKLGIGLLDQNMVATIRKTFEIAVSDINIDTTIYLNQLVDIQAGEQLFVYTDMNCQVKWGIGQTELQGKYFCYSTGGAFTTDDTTDRAMTLAYSIKYADGMFAMQSTVGGLQEQINENDENIAYCLQNLNIVSDNQGNKYKIKVVDGELKAVSTKYKNVIFYGNSITLHPSVSFWKPDNRGMAASIEGNDYVHKVVSIMKKDYQELAYSYIMSVTAGDPTVGVDNIISVMDSIETMQESIDDFAVFTKNYDFSQNDLLVIALGENASYTTNVEMFINNLHNFIEYVRGKNALMDICLTSSFWAACQTELRNLATELNLIYVNFYQPSNTYKQFLGAYYQFDAAYYPITHQGVAYHTNDVGMELAANNILQTLGYSGIGTVHNITFNASKDYTSFNQAVSGQIVTILVYDSSTIVSIPEIDTEEIDMTDVVWDNEPVKIPKKAFIFSMPDNDITVSVN